ncbi:7388_t:CDS:2 [Entrophospora sp. SA101]|nr:7388_t:CDS:2 [Entrophospora sp. SA101]
MSGEGNSGEVDGGGEEEEEDDDEASKNDLTEVSKDSICGIKVVLDLCSN